MPLSAHELLGASNDLPKTAPRPDRERCKKSSFGRAAWCRPRASAGERLRSCTWRQPDASLSDRWAAASETGVERRSPAILLVTEREAGSAAPEMAGKLGHARVAALRPLTDAPAAGDCEQMSVTRTARPRVLHAAAARPSASHAAVGGAASDVDAAGRAVTASICAPARRLR